MLFAAPRQLAQSVLSVKGNRRAVDSRTASGAIERLLVHAVGLNASL